MFPVANCADHSLDSLLLFDEVSLDFVLLILIKIHQATRRHESFC